MGTPENKPTDEDISTNRLKAFAHAIGGLVEAWKSELHLQIQTVVAAVTILLGLWLRITLIEWSLIVLSISLVLTAELINTAIEKTLDRIGKEIHPLTKSAKDIAAGAVLISACGAATVGLLVFLPRLLELF